MAIKTKELGTVNWSADDQVGDKKIDLASDDPLIGLIIAAQATDTGGSADQTVAADAAEMLVRRLRVLVGSDALIDVGDSLDAAHCGVLIRYLNELWLNELNQTTDPVAGTAGTPSHVFFVPLSLPRRLYGDTNLYVESALRPAEIGESVQAEITFGDADDMVSGGTTASVFSSILARVTGVFDSDLPRKYGTTPVGGQTFRLNNQNIAIDTSAALTRNTTHAIARRHRLVAEMLLIINNSLRADGVLTQVEWEKNQDETLADARLSTLREALQHNAGRLITPTAGLVMRDWDGNHDGSGMIEAGGARTLDMRLTTSAAGTATAQLTRLFASLEDGAPVPK